MADYSGALQSFETCSTLWTVPTFPLLAAGLAAWSSRRRRGSASAANLEARAGRVAVLCAAFSLLAAVGHTVWLARLPAEQRSLLDHVAVSLRIGTLDASLSLTMDALTSALSIVVTIAGLSVLLHSAATLRGVPGQMRRVGTFSLGLGAMLLVILASDFVLLFVGFSAAGIATLLLMSGHKSVEAGAGRIEFVTARLAEALLLAGVCVMFWSFGGGFNEAGAYTPDLKPRLVGVEPRLQEKSETERSVSRADGPRSGRLTMAALPNSNVRLGGAELCAVDHDGKPGGLGTAARPCRERMSPPFARIAVTAAVHDGRVTAGAGTDELVVEKLRVVPDKETTIALIGPTLNLRELRDQLLVRDRAGSYVFRTAIEAREIFGLSALGVALTLLVLAAAVKSAALPLHAWLKSETDAPPQSVAMVTGVGGIALGAILLLRLGFLLPLVPFAAGLAALLGGLGALISSARAVFAPDLRRAIALIAAAEVGIAFIGIGSGALGAATVELSVTLLGVTALLLAAANLGGSSDTKPPTFEITELARRKRSLPRLARASSTATLALAAAPIPALGLFWSREAIGWAAFQGDATDPIPGFLLTALAIAAATLIAFAAFRAHYLVFDRAPPKAAENPGPRPALIALGCAALSLVVGLLGASGKPFDTSGGFQAPLEAWLATPAVDSAPPVGPGPGLRVGLLLIGFVLPLGAWRLASRYYRRSSIASAEDRERGLPGSACLTREPLGLLAVSVLARDADRIGNALQRVDRLLAGGATADLTELPVAKSDADEPMTESLVEESGTKPASSGPPADERRDEPNEGPSKQS